MSGLRQLKLASSFCLNAVNLTAEKDFKMDIAKKDRQDGQQIQVEVKKIKISRSTCIEKLCDQRAESCQEHIRNLIDELTTVQGQVAGLRRQFKAFFPARHAAEAGGSRSAASKIANQRAKWRIPVTI